jgi:hypothetical protein
MNKGQVSVFVKFSSKTEKQIRTSCENFDEIIAYRNLLLEQYDLKNITPDSTFDERKRYNDFVKVWNGMLSRIFRELELCPVKSKCEVMLDKANAQLELAEEKISIMTAENAELRSIVSQMQERLAKLEVAQK